MKFKSKSKTFKSNHQSCSNCGIMNGGNCGCNKSMMGGSMNLSEVPGSAFYPLNTYNNDPTMAQLSTRMEGVAVSNASNINGGNDIRILSGGKKRKSKKGKKTKRKGKKTRKNKRRSRRMKIMKGGIDLGYVAANSALGPGTYNSFLGAPTLVPPEQNMSIFTNVGNAPYTGYGVNNLYKV